MPGDWDIMPDTYEVTSRQEGCQLRLGVISLLRKIAPAVVLSLAVLLAPGVQSVLSAAITCTDADYVGHYAFSSVGSLVDLPPQGAIFLGTISQAGRFNPDGKGSVPIETFASYNGYETNGYTPGATYSVSPDCVVSFNLTLPLPLGAPSQFTGILSEHGTQMVLMLTVPQGTVIIGQHIKQDLLFCGLNNFSGAFQVDLTGTIARPQQLSGQYRQLGRLVSDGDGNFTASLITNYNGNIVPETVTGTYTLNSECFLTLSYPSVSAAQTVTFSGAVGGHGEIAMVTVLSEGWGVSGTLRAQEGTGGEQLEIRQ
jgi:hypothetical protein